MKKYVILLIMVLCVMIASCGKSEIANSDSNIDNDSGLDNNAGKEPLTNPAAENVKYMSDRRTQFDEANKQYIVFFGLQTEKMQYTDAFGYADIVITDKSGYTLYDKRIPFSPNDFTDWTNQTWDSSRYMCGLYIDQSDIEGSASSIGELSLKVTLEDGTWFEAEKLMIFDLPNLQVSIETPALPETYIDDGYSYDSTVAVTKLNYTTTTNYDGSASVEFEIILKLEDKTSKRNESDYVRIGYKLYDKDGVVVDSGTILSDPIAVGESSKETFTVWDLDPREEYTLKFVDAS